VLEVLIFIVAAFVFYKLYVVLGRHTKSADKIVQKKTPQPVSFAFVPQSHFPHPLKASGLSAPQEFDENHFMAGALEAYKLFIIKFFEGNLLACRSFLTDELYAHFQNNTRSTLRLTHHTLLQFDLIQIQSQGQGRGLEAIVEVQSELVLHNQQTEQVQTILTHYKITFDQEHVSPSHSWMVTALNLGSLQDELPL
jgi:hypothetical protein